MRALSSVLAAFLSLPALGDVVARAGGIEVTSDEIRAYVETLGAQEQAALAKEPALLSQAVRLYLARRAVLAVALAKKWDQQPEVKAQLDRVRDGALSEIYLQAVSRPPDGYPSETQVQAAYQSNPRAFEVPRQYRLAQIFIAAPKGEEEAGLRALAIARKLGEKGADFAAVARADSEDRSAAERGGEIGWLAEAQMVAGIRSTVTGLVKDAVSAPIRLEDGWHIIKLLDVRAAGRRPLAEVREAIAAQLREERMQANRQAYLSKLLEDPPAVNELLLSKVLEKSKSAQRVTHVDR